MRSSRYLVLPLMIVLTTPIPAQTAPDPGSMVRISSKELSKGRTSGVLDRVTADSVVVSGLAVSRSSIDRMEVSTGKKSHVLSGMGLGFVAGAVVGALGCRVACGEVSGDDADEIAAIFTVLGGGVGGLVGMGVGALIGSKKTEQWRTSSFGTLRISPVARASGGVGFSVGFQF